MVREGHTLVSRIVRWPKIVAHSVLPGPAERRTLARRRIALFFHRQFSTEMTFQRNGFRWTGTPSCLISESIFLSGHYQDASIIQLAKLVKNGRSTVVNIGAHIGDVALPLSRKWNHVIAIEPNPSTFEKLKVNVRQNQLEENIECYQAAISDEAGEGNLVVYRETAACELIGDEGRLGYGSREYVARVPVKTVRLDSLLESLAVAPSDVALVWSDTQGFEPHVIESAPQLWAGGTCLWVEIWPQGLDCHGGSRHFIEVCKKHFTRIVRAERLDGEPEHIDALDSIISDLKSGEGTDALLIP
jgi:FkbM family methyltransferase